MRFGETIERIGLGRIVAIAVIVLALAAVGVRAAGWSDDFVMGGTSSTTNSHPVLTDADVTSTSAVPGDNTHRTTSVVVHVTGAVLRPVVYELPESSRVIDAVQAAGGVSAAADGSAVNLAAVLSDSAQVYIPTRTEVAKGWVPSAGSAAAVPGGTMQAMSPGTTGASGGPVNINTAGVAELDTLPGIGQVTAGKIVADRTSNGRFRSIDDLGRISGIGDAKIGALEGLAVAR